MKKIEKNLAILSALGILMNLLLIPGGGMLTIIGILILACFYFSVSFAFFNNVSLDELGNRDAFKGVSSNKVIGAVGVGIALGIENIGILFHFESFPGAQFNLIAGLLAIFCVGVFALIKHRKDKSAYYTGIFKRMAIYGGIAIIILAIPRSIWIEIKYRNHPAYRDALEKANANPDNPVLWKNVDKEQDSMENKGR